MDFGHVLMVGLRLESNGVEDRTGGDLKFSRGKFVLQHFKCKN